VQCSSVFVILVTVGRFAERCALFLGVNNNLLVICKFVAPCR
jgi:hypothetical protein